MLESKHEQVWFEFLLEESDVVYFVWGDLTENPKHGLKNPNAHARGSAWARTGAN